MLLKTLYWVPRILAILAILFMLMFGFDEIGGNEPAGKQILGFLIHSIPALILILVLVLAWRYELAGGVIFILLFFGMAYHFRSFTGNPGSLGVIAPFFLVGILFILHHVLAKRK